MLLPRPSVETGCDGCNWHGRQYERSGVFWIHIEDGPRAIARLVGSRKKTDSRHRPLRAKY